MTNKNVIDPQTKKPTVTARAEHVGVATFSGKVLVSGGVGVDGSPQATLKTSYLFDPATNGFEQVDDAPVARRSHQGVVLSTGEILVCTGLDDAGKTSRSAELFDGTQKWFPVGGSVGQGVMDAHFGAILLGQGNKALVISGANVEYLVIQGQGGLYLSQPPFPSNKAEIYDRQTNRFGPGPAFTEDRVFFAGVTITGGKAFMGGGRTMAASGQQTVVNTILSYDPATNTIKTTGQGMNRKREFCLATEVNAGKTGNFVVTGGYDDQGRILKNAEVYQEKNATIAQPQGLIEMKAARVFHAAAPLSDGRMIACGGFSGTAVLASSEIYKD
jgi:hypothetical protein